MHNISLQPSPIYGPVRSRRLGWSLGLNISPESYKLCSFNCIYCQYGWTAVCTLNAAKNSKDLPNPDIFARALENTLRQDREIDNITFSGNGEPTLHPQFDEMVDIAIYLKNKYLPKARIGILSNSSTLLGEKIRRALGKLDFRIMKLDAGDAETFKRVNLPCSGIDYPSILEGLRATDNIGIQAMFIDGEITNSGNRQIDHWIERVSEIRPLNVQIYSLHRPPAASGLEEVSGERLKEIATRTESEAGVKVEIIVASSPYSDHVHQPWKKGMEQR